MYITHMSDDVMKVHFGHTQTNKNAKEINIFVN